MWNIDTRDCIYIRTGSQGAVTATRVARESCLREEWLNSRLLHPQLSLSLRLETLLFSFSKPCNPRTPSTSQSLPNANAVCT